jgi:hypothetical protein
MRAMKVRIPIAVLAAVAVIAAILIFSSGGRTGGALDPVAQAAETTMHARGAHMSLTGTVTVSNVAIPITFSGTGSFNFNAHEGDLTLTMAGFHESVSSKLHGDFLQMTELFKSASIYIGSPLFAGKLPGGARWLRLNIARFQQAVGLDPGSLTSGGTNPAQYLQYLKDAGGSSTVVGHEAVRGVATTHYEGKIDLLKAAEAQPGSNRAQLRAAFDKLIAETGLRSLPVGVWADGHGLVRKVSLALSVAASGQQVKAAIQSEYYDFGSTPSISLPADSEVFDMTQQALQSLTPGR